MSSESAARSIIYVGMDAHKESITLAVLPEGVKTPTRVERLPNDVPKLKRFLARLYRAGELTPVRVPSEAEERVGDVVRCRETFQREILKSRHYIPRRDQTAATWQPPSVVAHAWKAQQRLHQRYQHLAYRKQPQIAVVAVARELVGFLWP
jgi:hypothetical protein